MKHGPCYTHGNQQSEAFQEFARKAILENDIHHLCEPLKGYALCLNLLVYE
jgi:hypothetical protein